MINSSGWSCFTVSMRWNRTHPTIAIFMIPQATAYCMRRFGSKHLTQHGRLVTSQC